MAFFLEGYKDMKRTSKKKKEKIVMIICSFTSLAYQLFKMKLVLLNPFIQNVFRDFPVCPVVKTALPLQRAWVRFLVRKLRSPMSRPKKNYSASKIR